MLSSAVAALVAGVLCWPVKVGRGRLATLYRLREAQVQPAVVQGTGAACRWHLVLLLVPAAGIGALLAGLGGGLAAAMVTVTVTARLLASRDRRVAATAAIGLSDALGVMVAELRAGAHPGDAVRAAAGTHAGRAPDALGRALSEVAAAASLGGEVAVALRGVGPAALRSWLGRIADAWSLADRYGIPLADLLDAVRSDTEHRVRFAAEVQARLAGPRATAAVLAGLPLLGLALGQAVGAAPLRVLSETAVGQLLLAIGTGLACAGVWWSGRLVSGVVPV